MAGLIRKAVIPAAGFGTRFLPITKVVPKELLPIIDRPTIEYIVRELVAAGVEEVIFVISKGKEQIRDYFSQQTLLENELAQKSKEDLLRLIRDVESLAKITVVYQEYPKGLGHAVLCARDAVGAEPFLVALGDDLMDADPPCAVQMVRCFEEVKTSLVCVQEVPRPEVQKYGIIAPKFEANSPQFFADQKKSVIPLADLVEKPQPEVAPSRLAIMGRYLLVPEVFALLEKVKSGMGGEIQLTDGLRALHRHKGLLAFPFQGLRFDAGDKCGYLQANIHYGLRHPEIGPRLKQYLQDVAKHER